MPVLWLIFGREAARDSCKRQHATQDIRLTDTTRTLVSHSTAAQHTMTKTPMMKQDGYDLLKFWQDNKIRLPTWYNVAMDLALIQPSSCFIERVFSMLRACMDSRQERALSDRIAAAVLLKYNRGRVAK